MSSAKTVNLVYTEARLLSGGSLDACQNITDPTCSGGVAAVDAFARHISSGDPFLVIPAVDYVSSFIQLHPLKDAANRLILNHQLGWKVFVAPGWYIGAETTQRKDMSGMQSLDFPLLQSNTVLSPDNTWYSYMRGIFFDKDTGLAVMYLTYFVSSSQTESPLALSTKNLLDRVARINGESGCAKELNIYDAYMNQTDTTKDEMRCWVPVVIVDKLAEIAPLWQELAEHTNPPSVIVDLGGRFPPDSGGDALQAGRIGSIWAVNYDRAFVNNIAIELDSDGRNVLNVTLQYGDIEALPDEAKDETYAANLLAIHGYAVEAESADPVVGHSSAFPIAKVQTDEGWTLVQCEAGECAQGNLIADGIRWITNTDFSFINSGEYLLYLSVCSKILFTYCFH